MSRSETPAPAPSLSAAVVRELLPTLAEINAVLDPEELLLALGRHLQRLVRHQGFDLYRPQPDGSLLAQAPGQHAGARLVPGEGAAGRAALSRQVERDPLQIALPLVHRERLVGVLALSARPGQDFSPDAVAVLQVLASHLAVALENALALRETRWYAGLLATLYDIGKETASILDLDLLLHRLAEIVKRVIDYEIFGILLLDETSQELVLRKSVRYGAGREKTRIRVSEGLCGAAVRTKQPVLVGDVESDPRYLRLVPETRSELVVPLLHKDKVVGVFDLESTSLDRFHEEHVKILTPLASQVAVALENARLYEELTRREERMQRELAIARRVQHGLFPEEAPSGPGWEAAAHFLPARELAGDLYDFYELGEHLLAVAVGDVAGKGLPAALFGAFASGTVRARAFERHPPADLLARVNRTLFRRGVGGLFCTLAFAVFDFQKRELRLASSGLPYPLHVRPGEPARVVDVKGLPLGTFEDAVYDEHAIGLQAGDVFVFYTDGLVEARNGDEEYGLERLGRQVEEHRHLEAAALVERVIDDLRSFLQGAVPDDDVTLVVLRVR